jgi:hypothetical protein
MRTIWLVGLLSTLLIVAYNKVASAPSDGAQSPDRSVTTPVPVAMGSNGNLPAGLSEYVFMHQARYESIPVHAMAGVKACPE